MNTVKDISNSRYAHKLPQQRIEQLCLSQQVMSKNYVGSSDELAACLVTGDCLPQRYPQHSAFADHCQYYAPIADVYGDTISERIYHMTIAMAKSLRDTIVSLPQSCNCRVVTLLPPLNVIRAREINEVFIESIFREYLPTDCETRYDYADDNDCQILANVLPETANDVIFFGGIDSLIHTALSPGQIPGEGAAYVMLSLTATYIRAKLAVNDHRDLAPLMQSVIPSDHILIDKVLLSDSHKPHMAVVWHQTTQVLGWCHQDHQLPDCLSLQRIVGELGAATFPMALVAATKLLSANHAIIVCHTEQAKIKGIVCLNRG